MKENLCLAKGCPALCCRNNTIHLTPKEFVIFKKHVPVPVTFEEVDGKGLENAKQENHNSSRLYFHQYRPDVFFDDSLDIIRLFLVSCPYLANNQCSRYNSRPQSCRVYKFNRDDCLKRNYEKP